MSIFQDLSPMFIKPKREICNDNENLDLKPLRYDLTK